MPIETIPSQSTPVLPAISNQGLLGASGGHHIWWAKGGSPEGFATCIVHGGPGGRSRLESAQWFTPSGVKWHLLDQRGCGKSTPVGALNSNTLSDLVADMEALRVAQGVEQWAICGGSWGALVALRYAIAYPSRVSGLMFRSPFLGTPDEINHFFERMPVWLDVQGRAVAGVQLGTKGFAVLQKLAQMLQGETRYAKAAARLWDAFEADMASPDGEQRTARDAWLAGQLKLVHKADDGTTLTGLVRKFRLQAHYLTQQCFLESDWAEHLDYGWTALEHMPVEIVQGDSDVVCPPMAAERLLKIFPKAAVSWVSGAGHDMNSPLMHGELTLAASRLVKRLI